MNTSEALSFAVSLAGLLITILAVIFVSKEKVLWTGGVCLVIIAGFGWWQFDHHKRCVEGMSQEIIRALGRETKTSDDIQLTIAKPDPSLFAEALDELVADREVGHELLEVHDHFNREFRVRGYHIATGKAGR